MEHEVSTLGSLLVMIGFFGWIGAPVVLFFGGSFETKD